MEIQAGLQFSFPPQHKQFTSADILLGRPRDWESRNYNYNVKTVSGGPDTIPENKRSVFVGNLNDFSTQNSLIKRLQDQKKDLRLKKHYDQYVNLLLAHAGWKRSLVHQLVQTPMMVVYPDKNNISFPKNAPENAHTRRDRRYSFWASDSENINLSEPIQVMSLVSGKIHHFDSLASMRLKLQEDTVLAKYVKNQLPVDFGNDFQQLDVAQHCLQQDSFEQLIDWQIDNFDKLIKSQSEAEIFEILERLSGASFVFSLPAMALGPVEAFSFDVLLSAGPKLLQAANSDTQQERDALLHDAIVQLAISGASQIASELLSQFVRSSMKAIFRQPKIHVKTKANILDTHNPVFENVHPDIHMQCHNSQRRSIWDKLCSFGIRTRSHQASASAQTETPRFQESLRIIEEPVSEALPADIQEIVQQMLEEPSIAAKIKNPHEQCINAVTDIDNFLKLKDPKTHITYRGILIWDNAAEIGIPAPQNHFAVVYKKNGVSYVFDPTAAQFADNGMPELTTALLLPEHAWIARYQSAGKEKIIKYKDFNNWITAKNSFGSTSILFEATHHIEDAVLLNVPKELAASVTHFV